jgi:hypothetical protein
MEMGINMRAFVLARLSEPSTWRGIVLALTALGIVLSPDQADAIVAAGLAVAGLVAVLTKG